MKKAIIALALLASTPVLADNVTLYTWEENFDEEVIAQFESETGHTLTQIYFNDEAIREEVITSGRALAYDLLIVDDVSLKILDNHGLFADLSQVNQQYHTALGERWASSCGPNGIPYAWGSMGIAYRQSTAPQPITSWKQLFSPAPQHQGKTLMYLDQIDGVAAALLAAGLNPYSNSVDDLKQAYKLLQQQQDHLLGYGYGTSYAHAHPQDSTMTLALAFAGEEESIAETLDQDDWVFVVPDEGTTLWIDCFAAPHGKSLSAAAKAFLDFINQPEIAAKNAESVWFATPNQAALAHTSDDYRLDPILFPAAKILNRSFSYQTLTPQSLRLRSRMLAQFQ